MVDLEPRKLEWQELPDGKEFLFDIWMDDADLRWAQMAWEILAESGLTTFRTKLDKTRVLIRLMDLAAYYHSFSYVAWGEGSVQLEEWSSDLGLDAVRVGQLLPGRFMHRVELNPPDLLTEAMHALVGKEYGAVRAALLSGAGGESRLFLSLWMSRDPEYSGRRNYSDELMDDLLNNVTLDKGAAFEWLVCDGGIIFG